MDQFVSCLTAVADRVVELSRSDAELNARWLSLLAAVQQTLAGESTAQKLASESDPIGEPSRHVDSHAVDTAQAQAPEPEPTESGATGAAHEQVSESGTDHPDQASEHRRDTHRMQVPLPKLTLGQGSNVLKEPVQAAIFRKTSRDDELDFNLIENRCKLKADAARWAWARRNLISQGATFSTQIAPKDNELIARAKTLPNCYLWMNRPEEVPTGGVKLFEQAAECYDTLREALRLIKEFSPAKSVTNTGFVKAINLVAEAQSALRTAVDRLDGGVDSDQYAVFHWLKHFCHQHQIFITRHLRSDDPADPQNTFNVRARVAQLETSIHHHQQRKRNQRKLLDKLNHKVEQIKQSTAPDKQQWKSLWQTVDELLETSLPPSNVQLRDKLLPIVDEIAYDEEIPESGKRVLREIDRYLAHDAVEAPLKSPSFSQDVAKVAQLLNGRSIVIIGGYKRHASAAAIKSALGLKDLYWIETRPHESVQSFAAYVARPDVALVVVAIRWSSHSYGEVRYYCQQHGKPLVRLPAGYNPNQIALQILSQCSSMLNEQGTAGE